MKIKTALLVAGLICQLSAFAQKFDLFNNIDFDSSYQIIGIGQGYDHKIQDSLPQFWFYLDNPVDMENLKKDWAFKSIVEHVNMYEKEDIQIFIVKDKRLVNAGGLIYPNQGIINSGSRWYRFDTSRLNVLHSEHPLKYHTEKKQFAVYAQYASYGNSLLIDTALLFFFEPSLRYEGQFTIITNRTDDPGSPVDALENLNKELSKLAPAKNFQAILETKDSFNISSTKKVKIKVECSRSLYDKYNNKKNEKGEWQPSPIEIKTFWKD